MKSIHDRPYYKKVYKKDSKNLKILIGHGSKQPKHAKKGAPYTKNPQKRRPVNKLSAPIIALDEAVSEGFKTRLNDIKEATFSVKMKKEVGLPFYAFVNKEKIYNGSIEDNNITIDTEKGPITKTKKEFLDKLAEYGELCNLVYCDVSTITIGGKILTFSEMLKPVEKKPEQPKKEGPIATRNKEQGAIVGSIADDVAKGKSIEKSVLDQYGHTAMGRRFAKGFADAAGKALEESGLEGDTLKAAALTSVMMGMVARVPFDVIGTFTGQIPDDLIPELAKTLGPYLSKIAPVLEDLQKMRDAAEKAAKAAKGVAAKGREKFEKGVEALRSIGGGIAGLPNAEEGKNKVMFMGNSQTSAIRSAFMPYLKTKGYTERGKSFTGFGGTSDGVPSAWITNTQKGKNFRKYISENKNKIGLAVFSYGGSTFDAQSWQNEARQIVDYLRQDNPNIQIVWVGATPIQKYAANYENKNKKRKENNDAIRAVASEKSFVFIDPYEILSTDENKSFYNKDGLHIRLAAARKILDGAKQGISIASLKRAAGNYIDSLSELPKPSKEEVVKIIVKVAEEEGFDPVAALTVARIESGLNPLSNLEKGSYKGLYQFGEQFKETWAKYGLNWESGDQFNTEKSARVFMQYMKDELKDLFPEIEDYRNIPSEEQYFIYLLWQQGPSGAVNVKEAADKENRYTDKKSYENSINNWYLAYPYAAGKQLKDPDTGKTINIDGKSRKQMAKELNVTRKERGLKLIKIGRISYLLSQQTFDDQIMTPEQFLNKWQRTYARFRRSVLRNYSNLIPTQ